MWSADAVRCLPVRSNAVNRDIAEILHDFDLLGKLSFGDLIAGEVKYHPACLLALYYNANQVGYENLSKVIQMNLK